MPVDRARRQQMAAERAAEDLLHGPRGLEQRYEIDSRLDPHLVHHRDEILAGDVAGRAGGHWTSAELAERGLEAVDPDFERREDVRQALAAGVVEVCGGLDTGQLRLRR